MYLNHPLNISLSPWIMCKQCLRGWINERAVAQCNVSPSLLQCPFRTGIDNVVARMSANNATSDQSEVGLKSNAVRSAISMASCFQISTGRHTNTDVPQWKRPWTMALRSTIWIAGERTFNAIEIRLSSFNAWTQGSLNSVQFAEGLVCNAKKRANTSTEQCMKRMTENQGNTPTILRKMKCNFKRRRKYAKMQSDMYCRNHLQSLMYCNAAQAQD